MVFSNIITASYVKPVLMGIQQVVSCNLELPNSKNSWATLNQHSPAHHPLDACYYSVVDEPQLG